MKISSMRLLLAVLLLAVTRFAFAAPGTQAQQPQSYQTQEIAIAKAQLAVTDKFYDRILGTVYWALGGIVTLAVGLLAYGWFSNFKIYERDRAAIEKELRTVLQERLDSLEKTLQAEAIQRDEAAQKRFRAQIKDSIGEALEAMRSEVEDATEQIKDLQHERKLQERERWLSSHNYRNALQCSVDALSLSIAVDNEYQVADDLDFVSADIEQCLVRDRPIDNFLMSQLNEVLDRVRGSHAHAAAALKQRGAPLLFSQA